MYRIMIDGHDRTNKLFRDSLEWQDEFDNKSVVTFKLRYPSSDAYRPLIGHHFALFDGDEQLFDGYISRLEEHVTPGTKLIDFDIEAIPWASVCYHNIVSERFFNKTCGQIVRSIIDDKLRSNGITYDGGSIDEGPVIEEYNAVWVTIGSTFDELASYAGFSWWLDMNRVLHFKQRGYRAAPIEINDEEPNYISISFSRSIDTYCNRYFTTSSVNARSLSPFSEEIRGAGDATYATHYPVYHLKSCTVDGVAQLIGIGGVEHGKDVYYNRGEKKIYFEEGKEPNNGAVIKITYDAEIMFYGEAAHQNGIVDMRNRLKGSGSPFTGTFAVTGKDDRVGSADWFHEVMTAYVVKNGQIPLSATLETDYPGFRAGQVLRVRLTEHRLDTFFFILSVRGKDIGRQELRYTVEISDIGSRPPGLEIFSSYKEKQEAGGKWNTDWNQIYEPWGDEQVICSDWVRIKVGETAKVGTAKVGYAHAGMDSLPPAPPPPPPPPDPPTDPEEPEPIPEGPIMGRSGNQLVVNGQPVLLRGACDFLVLPYLWENIPENVGKSNLLWGTEGQWVSFFETVQDGDYDRFWWRYFWTVKNVLGLNCVRLGAYNHWSMDMMFSCRRNARSRFDAIMEAMTRQANNAGVYIIFMLSGVHEYEYADFGWEWSIPTFDRTTLEYNHRHKLSNPMNGHIWDVDSEAYEHFISVASEIMLQFKDSSAIAMWDICEEADFRLMCSHWWNNIGGRQAFRDWLHALSSDLKARDPSHLLTHGAKLDDYYDESLFKPSGNDWWDGDCFFKGNDVPNIDVASFMRYDDPEPSIVYCTDGGCPAWFFGQLKSLADSINKPLLINEYATNWDYYNSQIREMVDHYNIQAAIARYPQGQAGTYAPGNLPGWPVSPSTNIPPVPGGSVPVDPGGVVHISNGKLYTAGGAELKLRGVCDSWQLCAFLQARGGTAYVGGTGPIEYGGGVNSSSEYEIANYFYRYAKTLQSLNPSLNCVRIGAHATEGNDAIWTCYNGNRMHFDRVLLNMARGFEAAGLFFIITLTGFSETNVPAAPREYLKSQQTNGSHTNAAWNLNNNVMRLNSESFNNLCELAAYVGDKLAHFPHLVGIEFCNEPDLHIYDTAYWIPAHGNNNNMNGSKHQAFKAWSAGLASKTKALRTHQSVLLLNGETFANVNPDYSNRTVWDYNSGDINRAAEFIVSLSEGMDIAQTHIYAFDSKYCDRGTFTCPGDCGWHNLSRALVNRAKTLGKPMLTNEWGRFCGAWQVWDYIQAQEMEAEGMHHCCILPPGGRPSLNTSVNIPSGWDSL